MKEIEAKILEISKKKVEETLSHIGAAKIFDGVIETIFFDFKDSAIVRASNVLRLRKEQDRIELTFKKVSFTKEAKTAEEFTVEVSSLEAMRKILENLGLKETESMQKHRTSYSLEGARFDIDHYFGAYGYIPDFMEIEAASIDQIHRYAGLLGFKAEDCLPWSTNDLVRHYSTKKQEPEKNTQRK